MARNRKTFRAVYRSEIVPCHRVAGRDRDGRGPFAADSGRDPRRFHTAFRTREEALRKATEYTETLKYKD